MIGMNQPIEFNAQIPLRDQRVTQKAAWFCSVLPPYQRHIQHGYYGYDDP